jgi:hypothetical protein
MGISNLKSVWRVAAGTTGLLAVSGVCAISGEPVPAVLSFVTAACGGTYIGLEVCGSSSKLEGEKKTSSKSRFKSPNL